jgi:hypothetical protein
MIQFVCDTCAAIKQPSEAWIVGQAAEAVGAVSARREVAIQSIWDRTSTLHPLAVHFCSIQCKDEYMDRLFSLHQPQLHERLVPTEVVVEQTVPVKRRAARRARHVRSKRNAA